MVGDGDEILLRVDVRGMTLAEVVCTEDGLLLRADGAEARYASFEDALNANPALTEVRSGQHFHCREDLEAQLLARLGFAEQDEDDCTWEPMFELNGQTWLAFSGRGSRGEPQIAFASEDDQDVIVHLQWEDATLEGSHQNLDRYGNVLFYSTHPEADADAIWPAKPPSTMTEERALVEDFLSRSFIVGYGKGAFEFQSVYLNAPSLDDMDAARWAEQFVETLADEGTFTFNNRLTWVKGDEKGAMVSDASD